MGRHPSPAAIALCLFLCVFATGRESPDQAALGVIGTGLEKKHRPARIALISDTHVNGPQYQLGAESNALDNLSVLKTQERLWKAFDKINKLRPAVDLVLVTGDFVHDGYYTDDLEALLHGPVNAYGVTKGILEHLKVPYAIAFGNHDWEVNCRKKHRSISWKTTRKVYKHFFGLEPYSAVDLGTWKLLVMNSELGPTYHFGNPQCDIRLSSYGEEQLAWAAKYLAGGQPTVVAMHHPLPTSKRREAMGRWTDIYTLLTSHDNVKLVLSGHYHKGYDWDDLYPFPARTLPALRYTADNFFLLELHHNGTWDMPDWEKNKGGGRCSHAWRYPSHGAPEPAGEGDGEPSDCGLPLAADTDSYRLPPIRSLDDIPEEFNPELSCAFPLAKQMLAPCLTKGLYSEADPGSDACCSIMSTQFQHGSDRPFDGCLCKPDFWEAVAAEFKAEGRDLRKVMDACAAATTVPIFYRGAGACPAAPGKRGAAAADAGSGELGRSGGGAEEQ